MQIDPGVPLSGRRGVARVGEGPSNAWFCWPSRSVGVAELGVDCGAVFAGVGLVWGAWGQKEGEGEGRVSVRLSMRLLWGGCGMFQARGPVTVVI